MALVLQLNGHEVCTCLPNFLNKFKLCATLYKLALDPAKFVEKTILKTNHMW